LTGLFTLAAVRQSRNLMLESPAALLPTLDFGMMWRNGTELDVIRAVKVKTALEICVVARKGWGGLGAPPGRMQTTEVRR